MGALRFVLQNWLLRAVNRRGAVSPEIRAIASSIPVTMPARAARHVTVRITRLRGVPSAIAAWREVLGPRSSMFSVVRATTGITRTANDAAHGIAEK